MLKAGRYLVPLVACIAKWLELGGLDFLGYPTTDELTAPDERGRYNHFQGGSIYWTPEHGAFAICGFIFEKWQSLGTEADPPQQLALF